MPHDNHDYWWYRDNYYADGWAMSIMLFFFFFLLCALFTCWPAEPYLYNYPHRRQCNGIYGDCVNNEDEAGRGASAGGTAD